jgi:hypothetical protein
MNTTANAIRLQYNEAGGAELVLSCTSKPDITPLKEVVAKGKILSVEVKQYRQKRSLDSNAYLWILCQKIAEVVRNTTKEEVYKRAIRDVGQFEILPIKNEAVERWIEIWKGKGLGWFAEVMNESKLPGYTKIISYYGSSCYNQHEMSVLIDYIVSECKEMDIETLPPADLARLKQEWGKSTTEGQ